jgi:hypothetical protein
MENLKIAVRGIGRIGEQKDVQALKHLELVSRPLKSLHTGVAYLQKMNELIRWITPAIKTIQMRF